MRTLALLYGLICYVFFLGVFLYAIAFVEGFPVPVTLDTGPDTPLATALVIDLALLAVFALQHSIMARPAFKRWWTKFVPHVIERSTYVLLASLALALLCWQWRPMTSVIWSVDGPAALTLQAFSWLGWGVVLLSTFLISHFELFGLQQVWMNLRQKRFADPVFRTPFLYGMVRHPLYLGFIMAFWFAPVMTLGHLVFAVMTTAFILIAIQFEEHDLIAMFGEQYKAYKKRVAMIIPMIHKVERSPETQ